MKFSTVFVFGLISVVILATSADAQTTVAPKMDNKFGEKLKEYISCFKKLMDKNKSASKTESEDSCMKDLGLDKLEGILKKVTGGINGLLNSDSVKGQKGIDEALSTIKNMMSSATKKGDKGGLDLSAFLGKLNNKAKE